MAKNKIKISDFKVLSKEDLDAIRIPIYKYLI